MTIRVIVGSARPVRVGDQIAEEVAGILRRTDPDRGVEIIDIRTVDLPMLDEPQMASMGLYQHEHTLSWARTIETAEAVVFVLPQYNFSFPASLKNAIDYLFREWQGKPVGIVSYGGHGGTQSADQFAQVMTFVGARLTPHSVAVTLPRDAYGSDGRLVDPGAVIAAVEGDVAQLASDLGALIAAEEEPPGVRSLVAVGAEPRRIAHLFIDALNDGDAAGLARHFAPDVSFLAPDGQRLASQSQVQEALLGLLAAVPDAARLRVRTEHDRMLTTSVALIEFELDIADAGTPSPGDTGTLSLTLVRQPGTHQWLITTGALSQHTQTPIDSRQTAGATND